MSILFDDNLFKVMWRKLRKGLHQERRYSRYVAPLTAQTF